MNNKQIAAIRKSIDAEMKTANPSRQNKAYSKLRHERLMKAEKLRERFKTERIGT